MIGRTIATVGGVLPVAAAAAASVGHGHVAAQEPVVWSALGYPFEAAGMIAALFGCFAARFWIGAGQQLRKEHRWLLDTPVSCMALAVSAALVILMRPAPFGGLMLGAGTGMLGEGIFKIAERYMTKAIGGDDAAQRDPGALERAGDNLHQAHPLRDQPPSDTTLLGQMPPNQG